MIGVFLILLLGSLVSLQAAPSAAELERIGRRVWQNECGGTRDGLTSWNSGEHFASLGIGHFIWYPRGADKPFEESFPGLVRFLEERGAKIPSWLSPDLDCPWTTKQEFQAAFRSERMEQLRTLLAGTVGLQSQYLAQRLERSTPKIVSGAPSGKRDHVKSQMQRLLATSAGTFALIDYVNFKGEGLKETERYKGEGWGLLQVLLGMDESGNPAKAFAESAETVLTRRVKNSPPERNEQRWLVGWRNRVRAYAE